VPFFIELSGNLILLIHPPLLCSMTALCCARIGKVTLDPVNSLAHIFRATAAQSETHSLIPNVLTAVLGSQDKHPFHEIDLTGLSYSLKGGSREFDPMGLAGSG
jgi:hypothetical protein